MNTAPHIYDPNAARFHTLIAASTRRSLSAHESHELKGLRKVLGTTAKDREKAARKAAAWGWA